MDNMESLFSKIETINSRDYGDYQSLIGRYQFPDYVLFIDHIPKDPYAPPHTGLYRINIDLSKTLPDQCHIGSDLRKIAFRDFLARRFFEMSENLAGKRRGTGFSGIITIDKPGQTILERTSVILHDELVEIRCFIGLPAKGRKINAPLAQRMVIDELPEIVQKSLYKSGIDPDELDAHMNTYEDAEFLRDQLNEKDLVAFIADGSILPRESGTSDRPLIDGAVIPFTSPESMRIEMDFPHSGKIKGMGISKGVTLIVGGGYHGKSTLLKAIEQGIYSHIPGDGRERCVSATESVKVRAYSGRYVEKTDISSFIRNLPFQSDTSAFSSENASGSTSQAANIIEAIEIGAKVLLMDEDTCATNFMIRDEKMQRLVQKNDEPITSFIDRIRRLYTENGISTILVLGGVGDYFDVADIVIQMIRYGAKEVTDEARKIINNSPQKRVKEDTDYAIDPIHRIPLADSISNKNEYGKARIYATEVHQFQFGKNKVDLIDLEQLSELSQTKAIAQSVYYARKYMDGKSSLREIIEKVINDCEEDGLNVISDRISGHFAQFRKFELAFAMNRMRGFKVKQIQTDK